MWLSEGQQAELQPEGHTGTGTETSLGHLPVCCDRGSLSRGGFMEDTLCVSDFFGALPVFNKNMFLN